MTQSIVLATDAPLTLLDTLWNEHGHKNKLTLSPGWARFKPSSLARGSTTGVNWSSQDNKTKFMSPSPNLDSRSDIGRPDVDTRV